MGPDLKKRLAPWALATGYGVAVIALLINALLAFWSLGLVQSTWYTLAGGRDYLRALDGILRELRDAETGQRNYLLTSEVRYLKDYERSRDQIPPSIENLQTLAGKNEHRQQQLSVVAATSAAKLAALQNEISVRRQDGLDAAIASIATDHGADAMDKLRDTLVGMRAEEDATRDPLRAGLHAAITRTTFAFGFSSFLALAFFSASTNWGNATTSACVETPPRCQERSGVSLTPTNERTSSWRCLPTSFETRLRP